MKNRLIALLLAFAMCFSLCSCGVDFDDDIDDEKDSEVRELDDYVESIYVYLIITMNKCSADDYEIFRMDYDHDGAVDWIVHCAVSDSMNDFWMLFDGGCVDASPKAFFNTSMQGELSLYKSQSGNLYVESAITGNRYRGSSEYFCYNGEFQEHCLNYSYEYTTEELSEDDKVSSYAVNGESCSEKEFDEYLSKLHLTKLVGGETSFDDYIDVPDEYLDEVIDRVCDFSFVDSCTKKDVDDDGKDDLVFSTKLSHDSATDTYQPVGFDCIGYENGCYEFGMPLLYFAWQENYYVLSSDSSSASIDTVTEDKAQSLLSGEKKDDDKAEMGKDKEYALSDLCGVWTTNGSIRKYGYDDMPNDINYYFKNVQGAYLFRFDENGIVYYKPYDWGTYEQIARWENAGSNNIKISSDGGSVTATVSFGYDKPFEVETMTLTSSTGTINFYKGQIEMTESDVVGTWENYHTSHWADTYNGGDKLVLYADHTYERTVYELDGSIEEVLTGTWEWNDESRTVFLDNDYSYALDVLSSCGPYLHVDPEVYTYYYYKTA